MFDIRPLSHTPSALEACKEWTDREWGAVANFNETDWEAEFTRIAENPVDEVFVAFVHNQPVGMVWLLEHEDVESHAHLTPWLSSLVVDPDHRNRGIATALVAHVETYIATGGDEVLHLLTETPAYYARLAYEVCDIARLGAKNVFVMKKALAYPMGCEQDQPQPI